MYASRLQPGDIAYSKYRYIATSFYLPTKTFRPTKPLAVNSNSMAMIFDETMLLNPLKLQRILRISVLFTVAIMNENKGAGD